MTAPYENKWDEQGAINPQLSHQLAPWSIYRLEHARYVEAFCIINTGLGIVLKFLKFWNLSWNVLKLELGPEICTYILKFFTHFHSCDQVCKNRRPYNLYCVGADVKPCSINQSTTKFVTLSVQNDSSTSFLIIFVHIGCICQTWLTQWEKRSTTRT